MKKPKSLLKTQKEQEKQKGHDRLKRIENKKQNLCNQTLKIYRENKGNSYETRDTYQSKMNVFNEFLADRYGVEKFRNVNQRHVTEFIKFRIASGIAGATINNDLSAIQWTHRHAGSKNTLLETRDIKALPGINVPAKTSGSVDRAWTEDEFELAKNVALDMGRNDCYQSLKMGKTFGMRIDEIAHAIIKEFKDALVTKQLSITGKGGYTRILHLTNPSQLTLARELIEYARTEGRYKPSENIISRTGSRGVEKEKAALENWMHNNRQKWEADFRDKYSKEYEKQKDFCKLAGLKLNTHKISWHGLRYNFGQERYDEQYKHYTLLGWNHNRASNQARLDVSGYLGHHRDAITLVYLSGSRR